MTFPNAAKGVNKIFLAEMLILIGVAILFILNITGSMNSTTGTIIVTVLGLVMLVAYIIGILGMNNARQDDDGFKWALLLTIVAIVFTIAKLLIKNNDTMVRRMDSIVSLDQMFASYYVMTGIISLAKKLNDEKVAKSATTARTWLVVTFLANTALAEGVVLVIKNQGSTSVLYALGIVSMIVEIIAYVIFVKALLQGRSMLNSR